MGASTLLRPSGSVDASLDKGLALVVATRPPASFVLLGQFLMGMILLLAINAYLEKFPTVTKLCARHVPLGHLLAHKARKNVCLAEKALLPQQRIPRLAERVALASGPAQ